MFWCCLAVEAVRRLKAAGTVPLRTVYLLFVPDEEVGGILGMLPFIKSPRFEAMNVGVVLDEGLASPSDTYTVFYGERKIWWLHITATGPTGHGSRFIPSVATEKLMRVCTKVLAFREEQRLELESKCACGKQLGDVTTMNLTALKAGVPVGDPAKADWALNVVPTEAIAGFDCRVPGAWCLCTVPVCTCVWMRLWLCRLPFSRQPLWIWKSSRPKWMSGWRRKRACLGSLCPEQSASASCCGQRVSACSFDDVLWFPSL